VSQIDQTICIILIVVGVVVSMATEAEDRLRYCSWDGLSP
jgi:hypothetical protein